MELGPHWTVEATIHCTCREREGGSLEEGASVLAYLRDEKIVLDFYIGFYRLEDLLYFNGAPLP